MRRSLLPARVRRVQCPGDRSGFVLWVVLVAVMLLSFGGLSYMLSMQTEFEAANMGVRDVRARLAAESAIEYAAVKAMEKTTDDTVNLYHDPTAFQAQLVADSANERGRLRFSVVSAEESNSGTGAVRFGLGNENARFNINQLLLLAELDEGVPEEEQLGLHYISMSYIPGMTDEIVDCILDWIDTDDDRREFGAEANDYASVGLPYAPRNDNFQSMEELLQVMGVTPDLLYGEDANRNGMLDANENDGSDTLPVDNADGILDRGWSRYLTVISKESNLNPEGEPKIDLNQGQMTELYDAVEPLFGADAASFVVAARLGGTPFMEEGIPGGGGELNIEDSISRNGIDLTVVPTFLFSSVYELIEDGETGTVKMLDGPDQSFTSPWSDDPGTLTQTFPDIEQYFCIGDDAYTLGRIDVNEAPIEVLRAIPEIPESLPDSIIAARPPVDVMGASSTIMSLRRSAAWLLAEGLVDLPTLRDIGPWITTRGEVYRIQAVGHFDSGGPTTRLEAVIDATEYPPRISFVRDLTHLGRGYSPSLLSTESEDESGSSF